MVSYSSKLVNFFKPYLYLMRVQAPTGMWLLLFPCWWGLALASNRPSPRLMMLFALGAFVMRGAGCIINDMVDCDLDRQVDRTRNRPLAAGGVSRKGALLLLGILLSVGLVVLHQLTTPAKVVSLLLGVGMVVYPFLKRVTYFPQLFLGLIFNGGILVGWLALHPSLTWVSVTMYSGAVFWTLGYDTLYALQDIEGDRAAGAKSLALWLGVHVRPMILMFYLLFCGIEFIVAFIARRWCWSGVMIGLALTIVGHYRRGILSQNLARLFQENIWVGVCVLSGIFLDNVLR